MATYGQMGARIVEDLHRSDTSITAVVNQQIQTAIEFYSQTRFWFNEARFSFTTSSSLAYYAWPATFLELDYMIATVSGRNYDVRPENEMSIAMWDSGNIFGRPDCFSTEAQQFRIYPVPNSAYVIHVFGQVKLATLSASTDTNAWSTEAEELIRNRAAKTYCSDVQKDYEQAKVWQIREEQALARLLAQSDRFMSVGRIDGSGW